MLKPTFYKLLLLMAAAADFPATAMPAPQEATPVEVATADRVDSARTVEVPATIRGNEVVDIYAKVGGFLKSISVDIGDEVEAGQELAVLDIPEMATELARKEALVHQAVAEVAQARAGIEQARAQLAGFEARVTEAGTDRAQKQALMEYEQRECDRLSRLASSGAIRSELIDSAQYKCRAAQSALAAVDARVATAQANLIGAQANVTKAEADTVAAEAHVAVAESDAAYTRQLMNYSTLRAPAAPETDGLMPAGPRKYQITKRMYDAGAFVQSADGNSAARPVVQCSQIDKVRVIFSLSMADVRVLNVGDRIKLHRIAALPDEKIQATVSRFSSALDAETRMLTAEADIDNAGGLLKPGYFGYVVVALMEYKDTPLIPSKALKDADTDPHVFVLKNGRAVKTPVTVGHDDKRNVSIVEGLAGGEQVILDKVSDGQAVIAK